MAEDILRGAFKGKNLIRISTRQEGDAEKHLYFDAVAEGSEEKELAKASSDAT